MNISTTTTFMVNILLLTIFYSTGVAADAKPEDEQSNPFKISAKDAIIALVRVTKISSEEKRKDGQHCPDTIQEVDVLAEFDKRLEGQRIEIRSNQGVPYGHPTFVPHYLPFYQVDDIVLVRVKSTNDPKKFIADEPDFRLPLGVDYGGSLLPDEVAPLKDALQEYKKLVEWPNGKPSDRKIKELLDSTNFFSWAVGVTWITKCGSPDQRKGLVDSFAFNQSPRQIILLHQNFFDFDKEERPNDALLFDKLFRKVLREAESRNDELWQMREKRKAMK